jgi:hypothetical protein
VRINDCGPESLHYCEPDALPLQAATGKDLAMSMIVNLRWPIASTNQHAALREALAPQFKAC